LVRKNTSIPIRTKSAAIAVFLSNQPIQKRRKMPKNELTQEQKNYVRDLLIRMDIAPTSEHIAAAELYLLSILEAAQRPAALSPVSKELNPNEANPTRLWAEIHRLRDESQGPFPHANWYDAAVEERLKRIDAETALKKLRALLQHEINHAAINELRLPAHFGKLEGDAAIRAGSIEACLENPETQVPTLRDYHPASFTEAVVRIWDKYGPQEFSIQSDMTVFVRDVVKETWGLVEQEYVKVKS
jgi:hypothetical protein